MRRRDLGGLTKLASSFGGHRYLLTPSRLTWAETSDRCRQLGGHLATITSREENEFLGQLMHDRS
jgi:hypothetical protein